MDSLGELEALMERMKRLQEDREDEETTPEEMSTRFEKEKKESLFVVPGETFHSFPHSGVFVLSLGWLFRDTRLPPLAFPIQTSKDVCAAVSLPRALLLHRQRGPVSEA